MLLFHALSAIIILITIAWLWRQGRQRDHLAQSLYFLLGLDLLRLIGLHFFLATPAPATTLILNLIQLIAWGILFWGIGLPAATIGFAALGAALLILTVPELVVDALHWGFLTAVPLIAIIYPRKRPFFPPTNRVQPLSRLQEAGAVGQLPLKDQQPILECIADGVIVNSSEGVIQYANEAAATIVGFSQNNLIGRPMGDVLARLPLPASSNSNERKNKQNQIEVNGRMIQAQLNIIYSQTGEMQGTVAVLRDITAEYQSQKAKTSFLSTVSHELRTPLTAVKGYIELLESGAAGPLTSNQKLFLPPIQRNVTRMVHLINSLIFVSSIKRGRLEFTPGYTDLRQLIQQTVRELQVIADQAQQQIKIEIDNRLQPIQADPIHISTILHELLSNSLKYNRPDGKIRIAVTLEMSEDQQQEFAVVSVSDNGIGIAPSDQEHIFEDFFRPDLRDEQIRAGGIGMGLSIVHALIEANNGRIWFESVLDEGTTFTFIIPTKQPEDAAQLLATSEISTI